MPRPMLFGCDGVVLQPFIAGPGTKSNENAYLYVSDDKMNPGNSTALHIRPPYTGGGRIFFGDGSGLTKVYAINFRDVANFEYLPASFWAFGVNDGWLFDATRTGWSFQVLANTQDLLFAAGTGTTPGYITGPQTTVLGYRNLRFNSWAQNTDANSPVGAYEFNTQTGTVLPHTVWRAAGSTVMTLTQSGKLGIGVAPSYMLDILQPNGTAALNIAKSGASGQILIGDWNAISGSFEPLYFNYIYGNQFRQAAMITAVDAGSDTGTVPLFIFDGRRNGAALVNRPIFGVTNYNGSPLWQVAPNGDVTNMGMLALGGTDIYLARIGTNQLGILKTGVWPSGGCADINVNALYLRNTSGQQRGCFNIGGMTCPYDGGVAFTNSSLSNDPIDTWIWRGAAGAVYIGGASQDATGTIKAQYLVNMDASGALYGGGVAIASSSLFKWTNGSNWQNTADTSLSRNAAGLVQIGDGSANANGAAKARRYGGAEATLPSVSSAGEWLIQMDQADHKLKASVNGAAFADLLAGAAGVPTGAILPWSTTLGGVPTGYLGCDGGSYSTTTYAALFAVIGYTFGGSGGSFNVPNLKGRFPLGKADSGTGSTFAGTGGSIDHTHSMQSHTHDTAIGTITSGNNNAGIAGLQTGGAATAAQDPHTHSVVIGTKTSGGPSSTTTGTGNPPFLAITFIIKT